MKINEITTLIDKVNKTGLAELKIESGDFKLSLKSKDYIKALKGKQVVVSTPVAQAAMPVAQPPAAAPIVSSSNTPVTTSTEVETSTADNIALIKAPMIGTFYRSQSPEKPSFISVGDNIKKGDTICIIEAMKLFNEIEAEVSGKVVKVLVDDASPVEYDQPIIEIIPD